MGSAVVKPLSRRRTKIKSTDPGDNSAQGNQEVNSTESNQGEHVGKGEPHNVRVDQLADPVSNLCRPVNVKSSDQDAENHQPTDPCFGSDEEPDPIELAKDYCPAISLKSALTEEVDTQKNNNKEETNDKVRYAPHLPLKERNHPPMASEHHRFRRLSSLFHSGGTFSCPPFRSFRKSSASAALAKAATKIDDQEETRNMDMPKKPHKEEKVNIQETDVCCDARSPSPVYDKLEEVEVVNPSPKLLDYPAGILASVVDMTDHRIARQVNSRDNCVVCGYTQHCTDEDLDLTAYPEMTAAQDNVDRQLEKYVTGVTSTSSSRKNVHNQEDEDDEDDSDNDPVKSQTYDCCNYEDQCCTYVSRSLVQAVELPEPYGDKEVSGSNSVCKLVGCEENYESVDTPGPHHSDSCEEMSGATMTHSLHNKPDYTSSQSSFRAMRSEDTHDFSKLSAPIRDHLEGVLFSTRHFEKISECDFRNISLIKEEVTCCDVLNKRDISEDMSRKTSRRSSARSVCDKDCCEHSAHHSVSEGVHSRQSKSEKFYCSSRNSVHKSDSRMKQTTPQSRPTTGCKSNVSNSSRKNMKLTDNTRKSPTEPLPSPSKLNTHLSPRPQDSFTRATSVDQLKPLLSDECFKVKPNESPRSPASKEFMVAISKASPVTSEHNMGIDQLQLRCRPMSEKLYPPMNVLSCKTRPISANVLYPPNSHAPQLTGVVKLPPITVSMAARQPTSKSEVFLPFPRPDSGNQSKSRSDPGKQLTSQSGHSLTLSRPLSGTNRPLSGISRPLSGTNRSFPGNIESFSNHNPNADGKDLTARLSPVDVSSERNGEGEQWRGQPGYEVEVNKCESVTDLRSHAFSLDSKPTLFCQGGDGPQTTRAITEVRPQESVRAIGDQATPTDPTRLDPEVKPSLDGTFKEQFTSQTMTLTPDQIGSIRQQLYEEGLKPAERDGGVAFFIPMTVDGLQPQGNGVAVSDRLTRSRKSSLSYEERLILANINRQAQLHKRKEFAVKDIQNVKGATTSSEADRSKQDDEIDTDLDNSF